MRNVYMTIVKDILEKAKGLFDVAGIIPFGNYTLLVLGLESTPERNLDDFGLENGSFRMYGFEKHVQHRLDEILLYINKAGYKAEAVGRIGYPLEGEINLKEAAIRIGIGKRGKNTVVLHPEYGPRLRFMGVIVYTSCDIPDLTLKEEENPVCKDCTMCIDSCPVNALEPYRMPDPKICLSYFTPKTEEGRSILCDLCLKLCPAGRPES
jgi:epoxyqueuosine reductase QueG